MTHQPEIGSVQRTVGLLRRLVILPARIAFFPSDPKNCFDTCNWEQQQLDVAQGIPGYLSEARGYEVVTLDPLHPDQRSVDLPVANLEEFVDRLASFADQRSSEPPSEDLVKTIKLVGDQVWVDGLVVIRGSVTTMTWAEVVLAIPLGLSGYGLLAAVPVELVRFRSKFEADIFETRTGKLIWASAYSGPPSASSASHVARQLLDPIEPALPSAMTRTIKPPEQ
jgi:hypothetical protein